MATDEVTVKREKHDEEAAQWAGGQASATMKREEPSIKDEKSVKAEKKEDDKDDLDKIKNETIKNEATSSVKDEGFVSVKNEVPGAGRDLKNEGVKGEGVKGEAVKGETAEERMKRELKREGDEYALAMKGEKAKAEHAKAENAKAEHTKAEHAKAEHAKAEHAKAEHAKAEHAKAEHAKSEHAKNEHAKSEFKSEVKGEAGVKRERSRSKKKDGKKKKDKIKKEKRSASRAKEGKKDKKRKKSRSPDGAKRRKSRWGPDTGGFSMTAIPRGGMMSLPMDDNLPRFNDEEMAERTVVLSNLTLSVTGQELIEFFNGAVLAVTANAVQQAANKSLAPVYSCSITEEDRGGDDRRKSAELRFRTPDGASVGMKLNGIEYKGHKCSVRRPPNYKMPEDGDPCLRLNLHEMSMARLIGSGAEKGDGAGPSPKLSIFNLPEVMSEQVCRDLLSQFGKLRMLSLIRDLATGKIKGYGIFEYDDPRDVDLAIVALNGFVCGQNVIRVQRLGGQAQQQAQAKAQPVAATAMANSMTQRIVSNPVLAMQVKQGREVGSRPSTVVQLINAVYQEDLMDDQDYEDITAEVHAEASKHGTVIRVVIPKPAKDGSYVDGVGKIFVNFQDLTAARKFQMDANGRKFESRVVCAAFYPMDKFQEGKYKLWTA